MAAYPSWWLPQTKRLPPGYHKLAVIVTTKERDRLKSMASLQPSGTYSEAIRHYMGWRPKPFRLKAALIEQAALEASETDNNEE